MDLATEFHPVPKPMVKRKRRKSKEFNPEVKSIVRERSGNRCERCKRRPLMAFHHCTFKSQGGTGELANCLGLCIWCHTEDLDSAHKSQETELWCVAKAKELASVQTVEA